ncbi:hypothetical protein BKA57DRAFT_457249 [Linnemannia elongata]|nr:hypothetical protein BKA57DRAFT_457249 [Linnemannia elongata]
MFPTLLKLYSQALTLLLMVSWVLFLYSMAPKLSSRRPSTPSRAPFRRLALETIPMRLSVPFIQPSVQSFQLLRWSPSLPMLDP